MTLTRLAACLALLASPAMALNLDLPPSAVLAVEEVEPLGSHRLAIGPWSEGRLPGRVLEGAVTRQVWHVREPGTALQLLAPLRRQIEAQGYGILLDCAAEACGGFDFRMGVEVLPPPAMFLDLGDFRYLSAEGEGVGLSLLVSRSPERGFVQLVRVTAPGAAPPEAAAPEPPPEPTGFAALLEREGRVVLEGLAFATGSADLAAGGEEGLAALAAYLAEDPARRVALVGHTDAMGPLDANVALSRRRAQAVADRLVSEHGVRGDQVEAEGMGWLAPRATNLSPEGRERNRRVEAVALPP